MFATLFVPVFITKRKFGLLGLALAAGSVLSGIWGYDLGLVTGVFGIPFVSFTSAATSAIIIIFPAFILLFHGNTYKTLIGRIFGASLFALLAFAFLIEPLSHILVPQGFGADIYRWLIDNRNMIIGIGLIASIVDLLFTRSSKLSNRRRKH
jgi:hypothetical protein